MDLPSLSELEASLEGIRQAPKEEGPVIWIVRRPATGKREVVSEAEFDLAEGLRGDNWRQRGSRRTPDGSANPAAQVTLMNARVINLLAKAKDRWALAGDQLYVDLDLSTANLPAGTHLALGGAVLEVSGEPHAGCGQFKGHFGPDALSFVNSPAGRELNLRGINTRVVKPGGVRVGDRIRKIAPLPP